MNREPTPTPATNDFKVVNPRVIARSRILFFGALLLFGVLLLRILLFQTVGYDKYQQKVIHQMTTESEMQAKRGNIYDANGVAIAANVTTYRVFISPSSIASAQAEQNETGDGVDYAQIIATNLSEILGVSYDFVIKQTEYTRYLDRTIKKEVDEDSAERVRAFISEYGLQRMIYLQTTHTRHYPYAELASHVLGFTGSDGTGLYGLEYSYNQMLAGTNGRYITARDAQGNEMPYEYDEYIPAQNGYHLNTTLDIFVQSALEEQLSTAYIESGGQNRAAGIVMNVNTGEILGMATYPSFNLNDPWALDAQSTDRLLASGYLEGSEEYTQLRQQLLLEMWSNKVLTEAYIPGSTFKVITAAMALEEGKVTTTETFECRGSLHLFGHTIHCHKRQGHGSLTFVEGIQQSCNPVLMTVGGRIGTSTFYTYLRAFGYLEKTGIDLAGEGSSLFAAEENFTELDLAIYAFGQNFNVTLLQQLTAVSAVANGGYLVTPHLVSSVVDAEGKVIESYDAGVKRQVISAEVCRTVSEILEEGVSGDGGAKNAYVLGYRVAAKTGTSEKKDVGSLGMYVCSTVAYAPADDPQYAIIIMVDEPTKGSLYGSTVAAPYVANVLETVLPYLGVEAVYTEEELERMTVKVPDCMYYSRSAAKKYCESLGLEVEFVGEGSEIVYAQYPAAGTVIEKASGKVIFYLGKDVQEETVTVPNVTGMTAAAANQYLIQHGLNIRILGTKNYLSGTGATAIAQSVPAGTVLPRGSVVEVTFRYFDDTD